MDRSVERVSLCRVEGLDYNGMPIIERLADISGQSLSIVYLDDKDDYYFENRKYLFQRDGPNTDGFIGVWEWTAEPNWSDPDRDYIISKYAPQYGVVEIIEFTNVATTPQMIDALKTGLAFLPRSSLMLLCPAQGKMSTKVSGVLCSADYLSVQDGIAKLKDDVIYLTEYSVFSKAVVSIGRRTFYQYTNLTEKEGVRHTVLDPMEVVRSCINKRAVWKVMNDAGMTKATWKTFKAFLDTVPATTIYEDIAKNCACSLDDAKEYTKEFVGAAEKYVDATDADTELLSLLVENVPDLTAKFEALVEARWKEQSADRIRAAEKQLDEIETAKASSISQLSSIQSDIKDATANLDALKNELTRQHLLANEVAEKVSNKISEARQNAADFIAEMSFTAAPVVSDTNVVGSRVAPGVLLPSDDAEEYADWQELMDVLADELGEAGVTYHSYRPLGAMLYSAYLNQIPVMLIGPNGTAIADAFSAAIYGRTACHIDCSCTEFGTATSVIERSTDNVIAIQYPFQAGWTEHIVELSTLTQKYCIFVHPHIEDLAIEPQSLFDGVMPIYTGVFIESHPNMDYYGAIASSNFSHFELASMKEPYKSCIQNMYASLMPQRSMGNVFAYYEALLEREDPEGIVTYALLPYALATNQGQLLIDLIDKEEISISKQLRKTVSRILGVE